MCTIVKPLVFFAVVLAFLKSGIADADIAAAQQPVVIFVHGRGQNELQVDEVRRRFFDAFLFEEKKLYGSEVVPRDALRFVWYADVIDPDAEKLQQTEGCRFASGGQLAASVLTGIRDSLIKVAQAAKLDDVGMRVLASDTYKYLTRPEIRCEADQRVLSALSSASVENRKVVLVAHSMGGIVSYSALQKASQNNAERAVQIPSFVTMGTQVGVTEILQGLLGGYSKPPVPLPLLIQKWGNFRNAGDHLSFATKDQFKATDELRLPLDLPVRGVGPPHSIVTYLSIPDVTRRIVTDWCKASEQPPNSCDEKSLVSEISIPAHDYMADVIGVFFNIPTPNVTESTGYELTRISDFGSQTRASTISVNAAELASLQGIDPRYAQDTFFLFSLTRQRTQSRS